MNQDATKAIIYQIFSFITQTLKTCKKTILKILGVIILVIVIFCISYILAIGIHSYYMPLVQYFYKLFNGDNIQFLVRQGNGKFITWTSSIFKNSFGVFMSLTFLLLLYTSWINRIKIILLSIILFFLTTMIISAIDSYRLIAECEDGVKKLYKSQITYDTYFIASLIVSILFIGLYVYRNRKIT